jgi:hypothetical protein
MFWALCAASLTLCALGLPLGDDAATMQALNELQAFESGFDRGTLERALLSHASAQGMVQLADVTRTLGAQGLPRVSVAVGAPAIAPRTQIDLANLREVHALGLPGAALQLAAPRSDALALALGWRLSRVPGAERYELQEIALTEKHCTQADLEHERKVERERMVALSARTTAVEAQRTLTQAEALHEQRRKWKASWKAISSANEKRLEALAASTAAQAAASAADQRYATDAKQAEIPSARGGGADDCVLASAKVRAQPSGTLLQLTLPTPIERRVVPVPQLTGVDFPVLQATGRWHEVEQSSAKDAIARLRQRFSWHYRYVELGKVKLGGMTVLQLAPLFLMPMFFGLIRRSRGVGATYNPFDRPMGETLPHVGLGLGAANLAALVVLPLMGCVLCTVSLIGVQQLPAVPVLCALGTLGLGAQSHVALRELLELREAVTRSHSHPPPAPGALAR